MKCSNNREVLWSVLTRRKVGSIERFTVEIKRTEARRRNKLLRSGECAVQDDESGNGGVVTV